MFGLDALTGGGVIINIQVNNPQALALIEQTNNNKTVGTNQTGDQFDKRWLIDFIWKICQ